MIEDSSPSLWPKRFIAFGIGLIAAPALITFAILAVERLAHGSTAISHAAMALSFVLEFPGALMVLIAVIPWALESPFRTLGKYGGGLICLALLNLTIIALVGSYLGGEPMYWLGQAQLLAFTPFLMGLLILLIAGCRQLRGLLRRTL